jgi:hypothetical protein
MDSLSKLSEVVGSEEIVTLDSFLFLITGLRNWKADFCKLHNCNFGTSICVCNPPFILFPFPTEKKDQERTQSWIKNINRKDPNTGKLWNPTYNDRVCSIHY